MKTTGIFTIHEYGIPIRSQSQPVYLHFFGDVHRDSPLHAADAWKKYLAYAKQNVHDNWFLGMGDYVDCCSTSERIAITSIRHALHESSVAKMEAQWMETIEELASELSFMKGRLVGLIEGNHYAQFQDGTTSTQKLCSLLGCKYLGVSAFIRLTFSNSTARQTFDIWAHHGMGAARLLGGSFNRVDQMRESAEVDAVCVDHETEILTARGWLHRKDLLKTDLAAVFDLGSSKVYWSPIRKIIDVQHDGHAFHFKNRNTDMLLSPNHRVIYKYQTGWLSASAEKVSGFNGQVKIPLAGHSHYEMGIMSDDELRLAGWIVSEGSFVTSGIKICQKYPEKCAMIRDLLGRLGFEPHEWTKKNGMTEFYIGKKNRDLVYHLLPDKKSIPNWAALISDRQFSIFLETLALGDGTKCGPQTVQIYSSSEKFIDSLQGACALHDYRTSKKYKKGGYKDGGWALTITKRDCVGFTTRDAKKVKFNGPMWCVQTDTTTFIARRNGKVFVTGNCMGHDHKRGVLPTNPRLRLAHDVHGLRLKSTQQWLVRSGSFLAAYKDGMPSYNVDACRGPCSLGHVELEFKLHKVQEDNNKQWVLSVRGIS